jgi:hypothetical protein
MNSADIIHSGAIFAQGEAFFYGATRLDGCISCARLVVGDFTIAGAHDALTIATTAAQPIITFARDHGAAIVTISRALEDKNGARVTRIANRISGADDEGAVPNMGAIREFISRERVNTRGPAITARGANAHRIEVRERVCCDIEITGACCLSSFECPAETPDPANPCPRE